MAVSKQRGKKSIMNGPASARDIKPGEELWQEIKRALDNPEMIDEGDPAPSEQAASKLKHIIEETQRERSAPLPPAHIEFSDGSIRLLWTKPDMRVILVIASSEERPSYIYHADIENGSVANYGTVELSHSNLTHWLDLMDSQKSTTQS
jgi:hypothetical protein